MSIYERQKTKQNQASVSRNREARVKAMKQKCSFCGEYDENLIELRGSDDIVYRTCPSCEDYARDFCNPAEKIEKPYLPRGYYRL